MIESPVRLVDCQQSSQVSWWYDLLFFELQFKGTEMCLYSKTDYVLTNTWKPVWMILWCCRMFYGLVAVGHRSSLFGMHRQGVASLAANSLYQGNAEIGRSSEWPSRRCRVAQLAFSNHSGELQSEFSWRLLTHPFWPDSQTAWVFFSVWS